MAQAELDLDLPLEHQGMALTGMTVNQHFFRDLDALWTELLKLAATVESNLHTAVRALAEHRLDLAESVRQETRSFHDRLIFLEQECWTILARYHPVASDLRRIATVLKVKTFLERLGESSDHLARRARLFVSTDRPIAIPRRLEILAKESLDQVRLAFDALRDANVDLATQILVAEPQLRRISGQVSRELKALMASDPKELVAMWDLYKASRSLIRAASDATRVAEAVIFFRQGHYHRANGEVHVD